MEAPPRRRAVHAMIDSILIVGSNDPKFKHKHRYAAALAVMLAACVVSGCSELPARDSDSAGRTMSAIPELHVATPDAEHDLLAQLLQAQFALDHDDRAAAADAYAHAARLSEDPAVAERALDLAIATDDRNGVRSALERWQALGAEPSALARGRAYLALASGNMRKARQQLQTLVADAGADAWRQFGRLLVHAPDSAPAGNLLKQVATPQRLPDDPQAWLAMSELGTQLEQPDYAREIAHAAVTRYHCGDCLAWAARLQQQDGKTDKARDLYAQAVATDPGNRQLWLHYAHMLSSSRSDAAAAQLLADAPATADVFQARAAYAARASDQDQLRSVYQKMQQAPADVQNRHRYLLGQLAATLSEFDQALDWFREVPVDSEHGFDAALRSAILLHKHGRTKRAHQLLAQARQAHPEAAEKRQRAWQLDARMYVDETDYAAAVGSYTKALKHESDNVELLYGRGVARAEAGDIDAAVDDLRRVLEIKPGDIDAANALGFTLADSGRNLSRARDLVARARKARPDDPAINDSWGWVQYRLGHLEAAEQALRKAWHKSDDDPDIGLHLAEVLWKQGNGDKARAVLTAVRKIGTDTEALRSLEHRMQP